MSSFAYLVAYLDTKVRPPRVVGAAIQDRPAKELLPMSGFVFDVQVASGRDFEKARQNLISMLDNDYSKIFYGWALDLVPEEQKKL